MKLRRKGSPYLYDSRGNHESEHSQEDRYYKVLAMAKARFSNDKIFNRKPSIPEQYKVNESKKVNDNFLRARYQPKMKVEEPSCFELLEPWDKNEEHEQGLFDMS